MLGQRAQVDNLRELPTYTISEAAHYLTVPAATVRYWSVGQGDYEPLIVVPKHSPTLLSFLNLTELHVLAAIRRKHVVAMPKVRKAIDYLVENAPDVTDRQHPLISSPLETDGAIAIVALGVTLAGVIFTATHRLRQDIKDLRGEIGELRERTQTAITQGWASMFPSFTPNLS